MNKFISSISLLLAFLIPFSPLLAKEIEVTTLVELKVNSSINPATFSYLKSGFLHAKSISSELILIKLNTPGGFVSTTKDILTLIGESDIPVAVWVTPEGASATSAGAIIASGAHYLFMSKGTNIGAATPIEMSGDIKESDARSKAVNDLVALVESLSLERGRNHMAFRSMIEKASSYSSQEAEKVKLIDAAIDNHADLYSKISNMAIKFKGESLSLKINTPIVEFFEMDLGQKLLDIFANPSLAYVLFLIGAALLYFEFQAPGGYIAGAFGIVALIISGIGFQLLPLNFGALGLIVAAFILFVIELFVPSFGALAIAGLASLTIGSLFLYRTDNSYIHMGNAVIFSTVSAVVVFLLLITYFLLKDIKKRKKGEDFYSLVGREAHITSVRDTSDGIIHYTVKIDGAIWNATSNERLENNTTCKITHEDHHAMSLRVAKA